MAANGSNSLETHINFSYVFEFENNFREDDYRKLIFWMQQNWHLSIVYAVIYVILIYGMKHVMRNQRGFDLRKALATWNLCLAAFSTFGACRFLPEVIQVWRKYGFQFTVCNASYHEDNLILAFWTWLFILSKVIELGDTLFIVLRKQELVFLHWYHHVTVLVYTWYSGMQLIATARWFIVINFVVHAVMYFYYALKAMRVSVPRKIAMAITTAQLMQMVVGLIANTWAYGALMRGEKCATNFKNINLSFLMYFSYFLLFAHYFYQSYITRRNEKRLSRKMI